MSVDAPKITMPEIDFAKRFPRVTGADLLPPRVSTIPEDERLLSPSTKMLLAMAHTGRPIYAGTANPNAVARRRAASKAARRARRVSRR